MEIAALYLKDKEISGPFAEKSAAWNDATKRGLVTVISSLDEDPPRRLLNLSYSIRAVDHGSPAFRSGVRESEPLLNLGT